MNPPYAVVPAGTGAGDRRIEWLDILRGFAAFAVVLFHVRVTMWVGLRALAAGGGYPSFDRMAAWITLPFSFFGTAVMLFFVVSGFAIHYPYAGGATRMNLRSYAARRFFRIYPPYLAAVIATLAVESILAARGYTSSPWSTAVATVAMVQNYVPPAGQLQANPSLWSLPVEVELYLAYPLLLWFWRRFGTARMVTCVALTSGAAAGALAAGHNWPMGNFAKYWIIWTAGAVLAEWTRAGVLPRWRSTYTYLALGGTGLAVAARASGLPSGFEHFIWGALYFALVLWGLSRARSVVELPAALHRPVRFLSDISYSLYLLHYPVLVAAGAAWVGLFGDKPSNVLIPLLASLLPLPIAYVSWRFIERPSHAYGRAVSLPKTASVPTVAVIATQ